jgi:hypothetical protein
MADVDEQLLAAIKRRLDPDAGLADILGDPSTNEPSARQAAGDRPAGIMTDRDVYQTTAARVIEVRSSVRALVGDLGDTAALVCDLPRDLVCTLARDLARDLDHARDLVLDLDFRLGLARDLARDLDLARALARAARLAYPLARDLDLAHALADALACDPGDTAVLDLGDTAALDRFLARALDHARALDRELGTHQVDASGADLSDVAIEDLNALDGVIWTSQTTWPPGIADRVRECSREIRPGVYQVVRGNDPDRFTLAST